MQLFCTLFHSLSAHLRNFVLCWSFLNLHWSFKPISNYGRYAVTAYLEPPPERTKAAVSRLLRATLRVAVLVLFCFAKGAPPDPKRQTPPQSPLRGLTFVKQVPFLTGSSVALRSRPTQILTATLCPFSAHCRWKQNADEQQPTGIISYFSVNLHLG